MGCPPHVVVYPVAVPFRIGSQVPSPRVEGIKFRISQLSPTQAGSHWQVEVEGWHTPLREQDTSSVHAFVRTKEKNEKAKGQYLEGNI